ncbi:hypothetical protein FQN55_001197 [Onygenales sp. PD_40]|nr:hypothetical protein FQN55_001197 [Onygenales sp. PD_40]KAK2767328.1 hypothetical protein FQN53_006506 [Emmonsiellopsis sp. PD_33]KAK2786600.1 hypothetical protein FQN52_007776 [Onygenales sp. PD_12]
MNPNFANHGGAVPPGDKPQVQMQKNMMFTSILTGLQNQRQASPLTGWQAAVPLQERALKILQMISQLRLIQQHYNVNQAVQVALRFEDRTLRQAADRAQYEKECHDKFSELRDSRQQRADSIMQAGLMSHSGAPAGIPAPSQNPGQPMFPAQVPRPMQGSPIPIQQPQQPQQQQGTRMNPPNQQLPIQHPAFAQNTLQRPNPGAQPQDFSALMHPEVCRRADQIFSQAAPAVVEQLRQKCENMPSDQRQRLASRGLDPVNYFFRVRALEEMRKEKNARAMAQSQNSITGAGNNPMTSQTISTHQRQMPHALMGLQGSSAVPMNGLQNFDSTYVGSVDHIQGQQADGVRSQEAGQLVVPANTSQVGNQQQFGGQPAIFHDGQQNANSGNVNPMLLLQQQHRQNIQSAQQENGQHTQPFHSQAQAQAQTQAHLHAQAQARARAKVATAAKAQMALSNQANPHIPQSVPQQTPGMSVLNRPGGPGQLPPQGGPPSKAPGMGQNQPVVPSPRPGIPQGLPPLLRNQLSHMSPEQAAQVLQNYQRRSLANAQGMPRPGQPTGIPVQQTFPDTNQQQQTQHGQQANDVAMRNAMTMPPQSSGSVGQLPQNQNIQGQQLSQQQRQQELKVPFARQPNASMDMTEHQLKEMDRYPFPEGIFNSNPAVMESLPRNVRTWGQLKLWVAQNPLALGDIGLAKLHALQKYQFSHMNLKAARASNQGIRAPGGVPMTAPGEPQHPFNSQQAFQMGQQQHPPNIPMMRPITANEVQLARQKFPTLQDMTDIQIKTILEKHHQKQLIDARNKAAAAQAFAAQALNQNQTQQAMQQQQPSQQTVNPSVQLPTSQPVVPPHTQPPTASNNKAPAPAGAKAPRVQTAKQPSKTLKRPNNDDVVEVQNPSSQPQHHLAATQPPMNQPASIPMNAMNAQPKSQFDANMRRQPSQPKQTFSKMASDEAWSNMPERIAKLYAECVQKDPNVAPVPMPPEAKLQMSRQLMECTDMIGRMHMLMEWADKLPNPERFLLPLLQVRAMLMKQFKPGPVWQVVDQFTISRDRAMNSLVYVKKWFHTMFNQRNQASKPNQQKAPPQGAVPPVSQPHPNTQPAMAPLNASNLQQLEQQQEALQLARRAQTHAVPPAPTSLQPPFPLGAPSPQGVPHAYGPPILTKDQLQFPPPKRRKQNQPAAKTPTAASAQTPPLPTSQTQKQTPTEARKPRPAAINPFRCAIPDCKRNLNGFASQAALDSHTDEFHTIDAPVSDALEFVIGSYRAGLGIDQQEKVAQEADESRRRKESAAPESVSQPSRPSATPKLKQEMKQEIKSEHVTPGNTPMGRAVSHAGMNSASPVSNNAKTPQVPIMKGAALSNLKATQSKESKKGIGKTGEKASSPEDMVYVKDAWAESSVSLETIRSAFGDLGDQTFPGLKTDPVDEILTSEIFTNIRSKETPSTDTGGNSQTPKDSDSSKDDDFDIAMSGMSDESWVQGDWVNLPGQLEGGLLMNDWEEVNWDTLDDNELDMGWNDGDPAVYSI